MHYRKSSSIIDLLTSGAGFESKVKSGLGNRYKVEAHQDLAVTIARFL